MRTITRQKKYGLEEIESFLNHTLQPVTPRPEFLRQLRRRLTDPSTPTVRYPKTTTGQYALLLGAGLLSSAILVLTGSRFIFAILGLLGMLHYTRRQTEEKAVVLSRPVA